MGTSFDKRSRSFWMDIEVAPGGPLHGNIFATLLLSEVALQAFPQPTNLLSKGKMSL